MTAGLGPATHRISSVWAPPYGGYSGNLRHTSSINARKGSAGSGASHATSFPNQETRENVHSNELAVVSTSRKSSTTASVIRSGGTNG